MEDFSEFTTLAACNESMGFEQIGNNIPLKDFFSHEKCLCGYAPHEKIDKQILRLMKKNPRHSYRRGVELIEENLFREGSCTGGFALENHVTFPPVALMSDCQTTSDLYYDTETGLPKVHWALVMEINHLLNHPTRIGFGGFNMFGDEIHVYFDNDRDEVPSTFSWSDLKEGNTIAILYAEQRKFSNGDSMVVEANLDSCFIFKESLDMVKQEAHTLMLDADLMARSQASCCFSCGYSNSVHTLNRCANCKLAKYCCKECQSFSWKESHKRLCEQNETLLRLAALPLLPFEDFFTFKQNEPMSLPAYKPARAKKNSKLVTNFDSCDKENKNIANLSKMLESKCDLSNNSEDGLNTDEPNLVAY